MIQQNSIKELIYESHYHKEKLWYNWISVWILKRLQLFSGIRPNLRTVCRISHNKFAGFSIVLFASQAAHSSSLSRRWFVVIRDELHSPKARLTARSSPMAVSDMIWTLMSWKTPLDAFPLASRGDEWPVWGPVAVVPWSITGRVRLRRLCEMACGEADADRTPASLPRHRRVRLCTPVALIDKYDWWMSFRRFPEQLGPSTLHCHFLSSALCSALLSFLSVPPSCYPLLYSPLLFFCYPIFPLLFFLPFTPSLLCTSTETLKTCLFCLPCACRGIDSGQKGHVWRSVLQPLFWPDRFNTWLNLLLMGSL